MEEHATLNWVVIDRDGNAFIAVDYLDKIPSHPPDTPVRDKFFNEITEIEVPGPASVCFGPQVFVSLNTLNMLLASASIRPMHANIIAEVTKDGYNRISVRLEDLDGKEVSLSDQVQVRDEMKDLRALVQDEEEQLQTELPRHNRSDRHDTPFESLDCMEDIRAHLQDEPEYHGSSRENHAPPDNIPHVEGTGVDTTPIQSQLLGGYVVDATPLRPHDQLAADENPGSRPLDRALVKQLRDLDLRDSATLSALLHDRLPPVLDKLRQVEDNIIHLATLSDGQVCSFRIFHGLYARREDLSFPSLADQSLRHRPITGYQKVELLKILHDISRTPRVAKTAEANWPPPSHPASLASLRQKLLSCSYQNAGHFEGDLERLATYPGGGARGADVRRAAVDEIKTMMKSRCAIGPHDVLDSLFNGLLREVVIRGAEQQQQQQQQSPRFVLPLGRLYCAGSEGAPSLALSCFVLLDVTSPRKPLWLLRRNGNGCCDLVALAEDIGLWRLGTRDDNRDGGLVRRRPAVAATGGGQQPSEGDTALFRAELMAEYPESLVQLGPDAVCFRRADRQRAAEAIRRGWGVVGSAGVSASVSGSGSFSSSGSGSPSPPRRSPGRSRAQEQANSPLRMALFNSAAARALQESPSKKRGRENGDAGMPVPVPRGFCDDVISDSDSDEECVPASERANSPLRMALFNSAAARALQESPSKKRGREDGDARVPVPVPVPTTPVRVSGPVLRGGGNEAEQDDDDDDDDSGSDEEWVPASERKRARKASGGRRAYHSPKRSR